MPLRVTTLKSKANLTLLTFAHSFTEIKYLMYNSIEKYIEQFCWNVQENLDVGTPAHLNDHMNSTLSVCHSCQSVHQSVCPSITHVFSGFAYYFFIDFLH